MTQAWGIIGPGARTVAALPLQWHCALEPGDGAERYTPRWPRVVSGCI